MLALLVLAGLMRPEAWVLGGLYVLWMWPALDNRRRLALAALCAVAPLLWAGLDWYVTGDPLHSLHGTSDLAEGLDRRRSPEQAPYWTLQYLGFTLREPIVVGFPIGLVFAWRHRRRQGLLPLAAVAAMLAVFMVGPVFGLPLIARYVRTPAVLLTLFYGLAVCGWMLLPPGRERRIWLWVGIFTAALSIAYIPWHARTLVNMRSNLHDRASRSTPTCATPAGRLRCAAPSPPAARSSRPPSTARSRTCAGGWTRHRSRSARSRRAPARYGACSWRRATCARCGASTTRTTRRWSRRPPTGRSIATGPGAC